VLKKTPYDLAGIQIRPAIQDLSTGEFLIYRTTGNAAGEAVSRPSLGNWLMGLFGIRRRK